MNKLTQDRAQHGDRPVLKRLDPSLVKMPTEFEHLYTPLSELSLYHSQAAPPPPSTTSQQYGTTLDTRYQGEGNCIYPSTDVYNSAQPIYAPDTYQSASPVEAYRSVSSDELFITLSADEWMEYADSIPDPVFLWKEFFVEGELCCLFADANLGKSILAVQIARDIALAGKKVLYIDFEMSSKQFQMRYMDDNHVKHSFPSNFRRSEINPECAHLDDIEGLFMPYLAGVVTNEGYDVVIVDNLTWMARTSTEKGDVAGLLMKALISVKRLCNVSMLVLAHTPKRDMTRELTQNDLAGSKMLINFFDAAFAIGRSASEENVVYLKQIKSRSTPIVYGADNVITCQRVKKDGFLQLELTGYDHETIHLRKPKDDETVSKADRVREMYLNGMKAQEIADELSVSRQYVSKVLKTLKQ